MPSAPKRKYVPDAHDVEVVKKIKQNEVELRDRTTVLRGIKLNVSNFPHVSFVLERAAKWMRSIGFTIQSRCTTIVLLPV